MDKNSLYRFFEGQASIEEMKAVKVFTTDYYSIFYR